MVGAVWAPFGLLSVLLYFGVSTVRVSTGGEPPPAEPMGILRLFAIAVGIIGFAAPVGCTFLGFAGISRIRHAAGQLYGVTLSVIVALLYPILILDGALLGLFYSVKKDTDLWRILLLVWVLLILVVDVTIVRGVWRGARRKEIA